MRERIGSIRIMNVIDDSINETKEPLIELIRSQILEGHRKDGGIIAKYSEDSVGYVEDKYSLGLFPIDTFPSWNLNWQGDFLDKIQATVNLLFIEIRSTDEKESKINNLLRNKGEDNLDTVYELSPDKLEQYAKIHFLPVFLKKTREILDL